MSKCYWLLNHKILQDQIDELGERYGVTSIILPPDSLSNAWSSIAPIKDIPEDIYLSVMKWFEDITPEDVAVVQGEFTITFRVVNALIDRGVTVLASVSERQSVESVKEGVVTKQSVFKHICFRKYKK